MPAAAAIAFIFIIYAIDYSSLPLLDTLFSLIAAVSMAAATMPLTCFSFATRC